MDVTPEIFLPPVLCLLLGYALGAIPFGLLLTRAAGLGDVRKIGSGNIGATNVLRTGNKGLAAATLILDAAKGAAAVLLASWLWADLPQAAGIAAIGAFFGHLYPIWLGFRGGKGVATLIGIVLALHWPTGLIIAGGLDPDPARDPLFLGRRDDGRHRRAGLGLLLRPLRSCHPVRRLRPARALEASREYRPARARGGAEGRAEQGGLRWTRRTGLRACG